MGLLLASPAAAASGQAEAPAAAIGWSVPSHFGSRTDSLGRVIEDQPGEVKRGPWPVELEAQGAACQDGARYRWSLDGTSIHPKPIGHCRFQISVPHEGPYRVGLLAAAGGKHFKLARKIVVQDLLIVSIGDSVASGEGVPDVPGATKAVWQSRRCHRSARAGPALAAKEIEADDPHTSVTFVHLACSGATVPAGLIGPYNGVESNPGEPPLAAQVDVLNHLEKIRPVDAVLVSVGANDIHFGEVVRFCALAPPGNCFAQPFNPPGPAEGSNKTAAEVVADSVAALPGRYAELNRRIDRAIPRAKIHFVEYFDPTGNSDGKTCEHGPPGVSEAELEQARNGMLAPLNLAVAAAVEKYGWDEVRGVAAKFRTHGYCAQERWVTTLGRSLLDLGGSPALKRLLGTLHPNGEGQAAIGELITADLEHAFFPNRNFIHSPPPGEGGSGFSLPTAVPVVIGLLVAIALLLLPPGKPAGVCFWEVVSSLGRAFRPLLLPLFVIAGVGAIDLGWLAEFLVAFTAVVLAWFLIGRPMLRERKPVITGKALCTRILLEALVILIAAVVIWLAIRLVVDSNAYFKTVGGFTSGLVTVSLVLWAIAAALRLFCFAESWMRALIAAVVAVALLRLTVALGILPGDPGLRDSVPTMVRDLFLIAAGLLVLDSILAVLSPKRIRGLVGWLHEPRAKRDVHDGSGAAGSTAALTASAVLLLAVSIGLVEAADRGKALHPPEGTAVEAKRPKAAPGAGDRALVRRYAPVLALTKEERWSPISVDSYLEHATLYGPEGAIKKGLTLEDLKRTCPGGRDDCYHLTIDCESGRDECAEGHAHENRDAEKLYREGAVYIRGPLRAGEHPGLFPNRGPFREQLRTLIQYWYFYYYDEWRAPVFAGLLTQKHEGDWEVVTLGLDAESKPLFVADSAHCGGSWRRWREIEVSTKLPGPHIHPLVAVAEGSHANYPDPEQKRTSDPGHCAGLPEGVAAAISYASNIRDKTEYGWAWYPPKDGWIELGRTGPGPMDFPGTWGASDRTTLTNFNVHEIGTAKPGPKTPSLQPSWTDPVATIFCGKYRPPVGSDPETFNC